METVAGVEGCSEVRERCWRGKKWRWRWYDGKGKEMTVPGARRGKVMVDLADTFYA